MNTQTDEIKFDYVSLQGDKVVHNILTLEEIEQGMNDDEDYKIVARRRYTNLTDKSGVEIYEHDVLNWTTLKTQGPPTSVDRLGIVHYNEDAAGFFWYPVDEATSHKAPLNRLSASLHCEVISNVYDNSQSF